MLSEALSRSPVVRVLEEGERDGFYRMKIRVINQGYWKRILHKIVLMSEDDEDVGISVRKEYALESGKVLYFWAILIWGDIQTGIDMIEPVLSMAPGPPPPPKPEPKTKITREDVSYSVMVARRPRIDASGEESGTETTVVLPHRKQSTRNANPGEEKTKKLSDQGKRGQFAYANGISDG